MRIPFLKPKPAVSEEERFRAIAQEAADAAATRAVAQAQESLDRAAASFVSNADGTNAASQIGVPKRQPLYMYDNPWTYAIPQSPNRKSYNQVTIQTLRILADTYDPARSCINHLKREIETIPLRLSKKGMKKNDQISPADQKRMDAANAFFEPHGGLGERGRRRALFEGEVFEDLLVIGATAVWLSPTRGGGIYEAIAIDAATIQPVRDPYGWVDPNLAWRQWIQGIPVKEFKETELIYDGLLPVTSSPYFKSPLEFLVQVIFGALKADQWNLTWLTDGTTPNDKMALPDDWTYEQFMEYVTMFSADMAGNMAKRAGTKFFPGGAKQLSQPNRKDHDFESYEIWLLKRTCSMYGVAPASIGYSDGQYKVSQQDSMDSTSDFGVGSLLAFRKALYDNLLVRMGYDDFEVQNVDGKEENAKERAERQQVEIQSGQLTPNEARAEQGRDPIEGGDTLFVLNTLTPIDLAINPPQPEPVGGRSPDGGASADPKPANADAKRALAQWERKALNRLKEAKGALCQFETDALPFWVIDQVTDHLRRCRTVEDVRQGFEALRDRLE